MIESITKLTTTTWETVFNDAISNINNIHDVTYNDRNELTGFSIENKSNTKFENLTFCFFDILGELSIVYYLQTRANPYDGHWATADKSMVVFENLTELKQWLIKNKLQQSYDDVLTAVALFKGADVSNYFTESINEK